MSSPSLPPNSIEKKPSRLRELDFLRGLAILFVLVRHFPMHTSLKNMGWIGVDLFFVLSGFLVSGLLFREYLRNNSLDLKRFLVRRGFKIYPIYYLIYLFYAGFAIYSSNYPIHLVLADIFFLQNYANGWGYAHPPSWTLAIEEHFYFGLAIIMWVSIRSGRLNFIKEKKLNEKVIVDKVVVYILSVLIFCLVLRIVSNLVFPEEYVRNFTMTHLRLDSLLAGVLIAYFNYFKYQTLKMIYRKLKKFLFPVFILGVIWTPFIDPIPSFFVKTIGFTLVYLSFVALLIIFILDDSINKRLNKLFGACLVDLICKIGFCSYVIYIIHSLVHLILLNIQDYFDLYYNHYLDYLITPAISIALGIVITHKIEGFFLRVRDKYYPSKSGKIQLQNTVDSSKT